MTDWKLYLKIVDECCEARRNHNIREDLLQKDIIKRFAKAIRDGNNAEHRSREKRDQEAM